MPSFTETSIVWFPLTFRKVVISNEKRSNPPLWDPTKISFTHTLVSWSTASKFNKILLPFHSLGMMNFFLYHILSSGVILLPTPDNADSKLNGTKILPS